jgi:hypothetical protein
MRILIVSAAITAIALLGFPASAEAQFFNGYRRLEPMGVDRPPGPESNARRGGRRVYEPLRGNYPSCTGFLWVGARCRLPTGQVCMVYEHGLDACV